MLIDFTQIGGLGNNVCLTNVTTICTNAAGVITSGGLVGSTLPFTGTFNTGELLMELPGFFNLARVFAANAANGLGSATPTGLPEPSSGWLFGSALAGLALVRRMERRNKYVRAADL